MDPVTQGALGGAAAQLATKKLSLNKKIKFDVLAVSVAAGMAPDLDILIRSNSDPLLSLLYHRHFTHSLIFIPVGALIVSLVFFLISHRMRNYKGIIYLAALVGYATHGLLDACTSYGTLLFWPFSNRRVSLDYISIIDPFFTLPLILGVAWTAIMDGFKGVVLGLTLSMAVLGIGAWQHHRAYAILKATSTHKAKDIRIIPMLASSTTWRAMQKYNKQIEIYSINTPFFQKTSIKPMGTLSLFTKSDLPKFALASPSLTRDFEIFSWFTDGYLHANKKQPLQIIDTRYLVSVRPLLALWGIEFKPGEKHIKRLQWVRNEN
jgi:inner membrane protein